MSASTLLVAEKENRVLRPVNVMNDTVERSAPFDSLKGSYSCLITFFGEVQLSEMMLCNR